MTVSFDATEEDAIDTVWYMQTRRQGQKNQLRNMRVIGWVLAAFSALMAIVMITNPSTTALVFAALYGSIALLFLRQEQIQRKAVAQAVRAGAAQTVLGPQEYTLTPYGIRHKSRYSDGILPWEGIAKIEVTETHLAFHFSETQAFLIPKSAFINESQCLQFLQLAQQYRLQVATMGQPVAAPQTTTAVTPTAPTTTATTSRGNWWTQGSSVTEDQRENRRS
ncbi:MAG: YcxB family protein [Armatimonas sp.]